MCGMMPKGQNRGGYGVDGHGQCGVQVPATRYGPAKGAYRLAEIAERGLTNVDVWLDRRIVDHEAGRVVAGTGEIIDWATAMRYGLVDA